MLEKKARFVALIRSMPLLLSAVLVPKCVSAAPSEPPGSEASASERRPARIEEVLVTAQRREEAIQDVPIAIQAFTGEIMKRLGITDTRDIAKYIPGFTYADSGLSNPIYTLRGVGFNDHSRTANSTVGVYIDEAPILYSYMTRGASLDLKRTEVLKGPQGTLYGRNTTGGAINYIANKPTESLEFGLAADYEARFEKHSVEGFVSGPLTDSLGARIALREVKRDEGWQRSLTRPDDRLGTQDKQAARAMLDWRPNSNWHVNFSLDGWCDNSDPQAPQAIAIQPQNQNAGEESLNPRVENHPLVPRDSEDAQVADWADLPWTLDDEFLMAAVRLHWDVYKNLSLTLIGSDTDFETGESFLPRSGLSVRNNEVRQSTETDASSIELRADGYFFDEKFSWLLGVYTARDSVSDLQLYHFDTISATFNTVPGVSPIANTVFAVGEQKTESEAAFLNMEYMFNPYFTVSLGARYSDESREYEGCSRNNPDDEGALGFAPIFNAESRRRGGEGGADSGSCNTLDEETNNPSLIHKELKEDNFGGKLTVEWTPTEGRLLYASFGRGFKSGSFPITPAADGEQYTPVTQERVDAIEIGGKTSWFNRMLQVNFALFDYDYKDKQLLSAFKDPIFGPLPRLFNAPESKVRGAELEVQTTPLQGLNLSVAASFLETEIEQFVGTTSGGQENFDFSGNELAFAPDQEFVALANYTFGIPFDLEINLGVDYSYTSEASSNIENKPIFDIPSYELWNFRVGVGDREGHWDFSAWVRNATDEFYLRALPQVSADTIVRYTGMPRTYGITFSYNYF